MEFTLRFNRNDELKDQITFIPRVQKAVADPLHMSRLSDLFFVNYQAKLMAMALLLSGKNSELLDNYPRIIESYKYYVFVNYPSLTHGW